MFRSVSLRSSVPINRVSRIARMQIKGGEESAAAVDGILKEKVIPELSSVAGFEKVVRKLCKEHWTYETTVVFKDLDTFKGYMESPQREKLVAILNDVEKQYGEGAAHTQSFVYDEFQ